MSTTRQRLIRSIDHYTGAEDSYLVPFVVVFVGLDGHHGLTGAMFAVAGYVVSIDMNPLNQQSLPPHCIGAAT